MTNTNFSPSACLHWFDKRSVFIVLTLLAGFFFGAGDVSGQTNTWDGSAGDNKWDTWSNWSQNVVPGITHDVVVNTNVTINVNTPTLTINSLSISGSSNVTLLADGPSRIITIDDHGSSISTGSTLTIGGGGTSTMSIFFTGSNRTMSIAGTLI